MSTELPKPPVLVDNNETKNMRYAGDLKFSLQYDFDTDALIIKVMQAYNLPIKDVSGSSDPYVKIHLQPDWKKKYQTKVHRKNLNPVFNETFTINISYSELRDRYIQFSVYDFDRFSKHDLIGQVVIRNILDTDLKTEIPYTMKIWCPKQEKKRLGDVMLSLCFLPIAGRLTVNVIKARNLKAMDITGASDPYVKIYLMCDNKRIRKKRTSVKRACLNPIFNESLTFDVPSSNVEEVSLVVKVMDYDRIGSDELIGCVGLGNDYSGSGKDHWSDMLNNPRKPVAQWHSLVESVPGSESVPSKTTRFSCLNGSSE